MKKIAFTICSINYLAQAKTLGDSLLKYNKDYDFYIGLVDKIGDIKFDEAFKINYPIVEVADINIKDFDSLYQKYNITELNTAVKPFFLNYFYNHFPTATNVIYFDPDIEIFQPINELNTNLEKYNIVLTPHILSPYLDNKSPKETDLLNTGIFNLGFIATSRSKDTSDFLTWWEQKLRYECYIDLANGMFVDQLWVNFVPVYWSNVYIEKSPAYNMAYWNLHERNLNKKNENWVVNEKTPLIFFHFSGFTPTKSALISKYQDRFEFQERADLVPVFENYAKLLFENGYEYYGQFKCAYMKPALLWVPPKRGQRPRKWIIKQLNSLIDLVNKI